MDLDAELGEFEQALLQLVWRSVEVEREVRKRINDVQLGLGGPPRLGAALLVERGDVVEDRLPFGLQVVVALPQALHERIVRVRVLSLAE